VNAPDDVEAPVAPPPAAGRMRGGRLQKKVLLALTSSLVVAITTAGVALYRHQRGLLMDALQQRSRSISRAVAIAIQDAALGNSLAQVQRILRQMVKEQTDLISIRVHRPSWVMPLEDRDPDEETEGSGPRASEESLEFKHEIQVNGNPYGTVEIRFSTQHLSAVLLQLRTWLFLFVLGFTAGLALLLGFLLRRQVLLPLERLQMFAEQMREGNLEAAVPVSSSDEIGRLSQAFNEMGEAIRQRNEKLQLSHRTILASFARVRAILGGLSEGVIVIDAQGRVLLANREAEQIVGCADGELLGTQVVQVFPGEARDRIKTLLSRPAAPQDGGTAAREDLTFRHRDRDYRLGAAPVVTPQGDFSGTALVIQDVTRLMEVARMKDDFISSVSHELRTPLTSIKSFAEILLTYADEDAAVRREFLEIINRESQRLSRLINDILDVSRIEAGKLDWREEEIVVGEVALETAQALEAVIRERAVRLVVEPAEGVPPIRGDRDRLAQVFMNLMGNAVKFTPSGGEIRVRFQRDLPEGFLRVEVADNGPGIAREELQLIFEKFHQSGDTLRSKPSGTGLGLYICRRILTRFGGEIWAESELGRGSRFIFTLPTPEAPRPPAAKPVAEPEGAPARASILVVDDEESFRQFLRFELGRLGFRLIEAENGQRAIELAHTQRPDLITLDLIMEEQNGYDVAQELQQDAATREIPLLVVSILEQREVGRPEWAQEVLTKPVAPRDLLASLGRLLSRSRPLALLVGVSPPLRDRLAEELRAAGMIPLTLSPENGSAASLLDGEVRVGAIVADLSGQWEATLLRIRDFRVRLGPRRLPLVLLTRGGGEQQSRTLAALGPLAILPADVEATRVLGALGLGKTEPAAPPAGT
jgi:PAS domain S-box-containing protein